MNFEQIIETVIESEFGVEKEGVVSIIVDEQKRIASRLLEVDLLKDDIILMTIYIKRLYGDRESKSYARHRKRIKNEFDILKKTYNETNSNCDFSVVRPLAVYPDSLSLVTCSAGDKTVINLFKSSIAWWNYGDSFDKSRKIAADCGRFLFMMQENNFVRHETVDSGELITKIHNMLDVIFKNEVIFHYKIKESIDSFVNKNFSKLSESIVLSKIHGDYTPSNILVKDEKIFVLDFGDCDVGSVYLDMARFFQMLEYYTGDPRFSTSKINILLKEFLSCFDAIDCVLLTFFRIEILLQGIKERLRLQDEYKKKDYATYLINGWYVRQRVKKLCLVCRGQDPLSLI